MTCRPSNNVVVCNSCKAQITQLFSDIDHKIAKQFGGTDDETNKQTLCLNCHRVKSRYEQTQLVPFRQQLSQVLSQFFYKHDGIITCKIRANQIACNVVRQILEQSSFDLNSAAKKLLGAVNLDTEKTNWRTFFDQHIEIDTTKSLYIYDVRSLVKKHFNAIISDEEIKREFTQRGFIYFWNKRTSRHGKKTRGSFMQCCLKKRNANSKRKRVENKSLEFVEHDKKKRHVG